MLGMLEEVDVDELADFEIMGGDILDHLSKELGDIATFRDELLSARACQRSSDKDQGPRTAISRFIASSFSLSLFESSCLRMFFSFSSGVSK